MIESSIGAITYIQNDWSILEICCKCLYETQINSRQVIDSIGH